MAGNNDGPALHARFGTQLVLDVDGARIGVTHGHLGPGATTRDRAHRAFADEPGLDAIVFGHSHIPLVERLDGGTWLVNPGSPTDRRRQPLFTWALHDDRGRGDQRGRAPVVRVDRADETDARAPSTRAARRTTGSRST